MAVVVIDTIKPKNNGTFPVVEAVDVKVTNSQRLDAALNEKANQSDVTALQTTVAGKASQADLNTLSATVAGKQAALTETQLTAVNSGITSALVAQIGTNTTAIAGKASQAEVDLKADESELTTATANLQSQIDALITPVTQDAEVENARVGAGGATYTTLKARCDDEISNVNEALNITPRVITPVYSTYTGKFVTPAGTISNNASFSLSDFIPISAECKAIVLKSRVVNSYVNAISFFTTDTLETANYISGATVTTAGDLTVNVPEGANYCVIGSNTNESGNTSTGDSYAYKFKSINERFVPIYGAIQDSVDNTNAELNITNSTITPVYSTYEGKYVTPSGTIGSNAAFSVSNLIPVTTAFKQVVCKNRANNSSVNAISFFSKNELSSEYYISGGVCESAGNVTFNIPLNAKYMAIGSNTTSGGTTFEGDEYNLTFRTVNERVDGKANTLENEIASIVKVTPKTETEGTGEDLSIATPDVKWGVEIGYYAKLSSFDKIEIGRGSTVYDSWYVEIDNTDIIVHKYTDADTVVYTHAHGLTISDYIQVLLCFNYGYTVKIIINTVSGTYIVDTADVKLYTGRNNLYAKSSNGTSISFNKLTWCATSLEKKIWLFGDSYLDHYPEYLHQWGYDNVMLDGFSGRQSFRAIESLNADLEYRTPSCILWGMGMNDGDEGSAINANWKRYAEQAIAICNRKNIKLIFLTIPNTPTIDNSYKNAYIRSSGYDYIDIAYCVNGDTSSDTWYNGFLKSDNVHATALGRQAIATYLISHLPQLKNPF